MHTHIWILFRWENKIFNTSNYQFYITAHLSSHPSLPSPISFSTEKGAKSLRRRYCFSFLFSSSDFHYRVLIWRTKPIFRQPSRYIILCCCYLFCVRLLIFDSYCCLLTSDTKAVSVCVCAESMFARIFAYEYIFSVFSHCFWYLP